MNRSGTEWLGELDADSARQFDRLVRLYDAAGEPFPAAAAVWRHLSSGELAALAALTSDRKPSPFTADWLSLSPTDRARALVAMKLAIALGAACAEALQLELQLRAGAKR